MEVGCGSRSSQNCTYFSSTADLNAAAGGGGGGTCSATICRCDPGVCQVKGKNKLFSSQISKNNTKPKVASGPPRLLPPRPLPELGRRRPGGQRGGQGGEPGQRSRLRHGNKVWRIFFEVNETISSCFISTGAWTRPSSCPTPVAPPRRQGSAGNSRENTVCLS